MAASGFWIGVEAMPLSVLCAATEHERPIFCGRLSLNQTFQAELGDVHERAEWHDVALDTAIGRGYLIDLLRQRLPVERVVLALDVSADKHYGDRFMASLDEYLVRTRGIVEALIVVTRGVEAMMPPGSGTLTVMLRGPRQAYSPLTEGLAAFVEKFVSAEAALWAEGGRSLRIERADSDE